MECVCGMFGEDSAALSFHLGPPDGCIRRYCSRSSQPEIKFICAHVYIRLLP